MLACWSFHIQLNVFRQIKSNWCHDKNIFAAIPFINISQTNNVISFWRLIVLHDILLGQSKVNIEMWTYAKNVNICHQYIYITSPQIYTRISFHGVLYFVTKIKMVNQWYQIIIATPILKFANSDTFTSDFLTVCRGTNSTKQVKIYNFWFLVAIWSTAPMVEKYQF